MNEAKTIVVVGGGIAGVSCVLELIENAEHDDSVNFGFICGKSGFIKTVQNYEKIGNYLEKFDIQAQVPDQEFFKSKKIRIFMEDVEFWNSNENTIRLTNSQILHYDSLCIATGALPRSITKAPMNSIIQIRDTDTIEKLQNRLKTARRIVIVGDGGIAMEAAYELRNLDIFWASKLPYVGKPFFDATISLALEERFKNGRGEGDMKKEVRFDKFMVQTSNQSNEKSTPGCSLGPNWLAKLTQTTNQDQARKLTIMRCVEVVAYHSKSFTKSDEKWDIYVEFSDGQIIGCDFVIEALGVFPNSEKWKQWCPELKLSEDLGIEINEHMQTNLDNVFACGDVCTIKRNEESRLWKQMRLWTQAKNLGLFTARCMLDPELEFDSWFDMFAHVTTFAGNKIVLLGDYLAETGDVEHVFNGDCLTRVAFENNRMVGAILVGQTDFDEVFETLIVNSFDLSDIPRPIVNDQVDIADYFD